MVLVSCLFQETFDWQVLTLLNAFITQLSVKGGSECYLKQTEHIPLVCLTRAYKVYCLRPI